jgi:hypothetical protein
MKVKRRAVVEAYRHRLDELYRSGARRRPDVAGS